ncbi:hypothetical protein GCM10009843_17630 [Nocardioides bigeumensis]|uniref:HNH domain-containing protein n=1 Tax=Nocardioides bigeumensis TaxID=433657 RepID=A0ABP5JVC7_9ACTN
MNGASATVCQKVLKRSNNMVAARYPRRCDRRGNGVDVRQDVCSECHAQKSTFVWTMRRADSPAVSQGYPG